MRKISLLGHLIVKFADHPENIATEALNHILNSSSTARKSFLRYIELTSIKFDGDLNFKAQEAYEDGIIPDLTGADSDGKKVLIIESKFWAGLTENQPVAYLKKLPEGRNGMLLFIAPVKRVQTLWDELRRLCKNNDDDIIIGKTWSVGDKDKLFIASLNKNRYMAVASWRSVLSYILLLIEREGEADVASDISQLQGLVEQMDESAFLPLNSEDLAPNIGTRMIQYCNLVRDVTGKLVEEAVVEKKNYQTGKRLGIYAQYMDICGFACSLEFNAHLWSNQRETPLWLFIWNESQVPAAKKRLTKLELEEPSRLLQIDGQLFIPLYLPTGTERNAVINDLKSQITKIADLLKAGTP